MSTRTWQDFDTRQEYAAYLTGVAEATHRMVWPTVESNRNNAPRIVITEANWNELTGETQRRLRAEANAGPIERREG